MSQNNRDSHFMAGALALVRRRLGTTAPNPCVGCVIVKDGVIMGRGVTQPGGRPHAETQALAMAGEQALDATAYVTLEPCSHHGQTPPCSDALIAAGIARVVCALQDPDERVSGSGLEKLRSAGIEVVTGVGEAAARHLASGFLKTKEEGRPHFTLKLASSMDGRIALGDGSSQWITGPAARRYAHHLRATHDAVLVGSGTALADDPQLSCRLPGAQPADQPVRVVLDRRGRLPSHGRLAASAADQPVVVITSVSADPEWMGALANHGVTVVTPPDQSLSVAGVAQILSQRGLTRVLIEGGSQVAESFLSADLVDELVWISSPKILGGDALPAIGPMGLTQVPQKPGFQAVRDFPLDADRVVVYTRA